MAPGAGGDILEDGFLVQWKGTNPATGEAWNPVWVSRDSCPADMIAKWESSKVGDADRVSETLGAPSSFHATELTALTRDSAEATVNTLKRSASPVTATIPDLPIDRDVESCKKKPKLEKQTGSAKGRSTYTGFRPFYQKPKPKPVQRKVVRMSA
ncbi:uncharacterized protein B0H18DRAFT_314895 [Fomitopsis serialis]|uniref:uncharacterized protein n=1 Tax=Fomitopsis serialis TaxID=139415 RepID=UPI00200801DD|nr:uncharacterized protein B0H18DRAFT_314895 [Neoantrodia serialis]KAH9936168.1 hypothetical protein B0H18DRAFT_314895 [Neoantrodia serialis]